MQGVGVVFQVYLTSRIGPEGIGLWQLTLSVYTLAVTVAISGVRFAATRLVAEELGLGCHRGARTAMVRCLGYAGIFGCGAALLLWMTAPALAAQWIGDPRCALGLRVLALGLPCLSLGAAFGGYFTAVQRVLRAASAQALEQLVRIAVTVALLGSAVSGDLEYACAAVAAGSMAGEVCSLGALWFLYLVDVRRYNRPGAPPPRMTRRLLSTALPVAFSAYARTLLSTIQHLLIPWGLRKSGASSHGALASYGIIHGMVFPLVFFPAALLTALAELLVPELTRCQVAGRRDRVDHMVSRVFYLGLLFSFGTAGLVWGFSGELGRIVYNSPQASGYLRTLAPLIPVMYMDMLTDGMLKGLGQQMASMRYNIVDSLCSVILVFLLLPRFAIGGYLFTVWFTEVLNFALSVGKLLRVSGLRISLWGSILRPAGCIASAVLLCPVLTRWVNLSVSLSGGILALRMALALVLYLLLLVLTGGLTREDASWFRGILPGERKSRPAPAHRGERPF